MDSEARTSAVQRAPTDSLNDFLIASVILIKILYLFIIHLPLFKLIKSYHYGEKKCFCMESKS